MRTSLAVVLVVMIAGCGAAQRGGSCDVQLLRPIQDCPDLRGGWSGFVVFEVITGSQRGAHVIGGYGEAGASEPKWTIARVVVGSTSSATGWTNQCGGFEGTQGPVYAGRVVAGDVFDTQVRAEQAYERRCD